MHLLLVIAVAVGFYKAWNIGANDVANGMSMVVGSGTLTLRRAIILAAIFEFLGAFLVGSHVTETIKGNIIDFKPFADRPMMFGIGMLSVALASAIWLNVATLLSRPISVTQATIGGILGFAMVSPVGLLGSANWPQLGVSRWDGSSRRSPARFGPYVIFRCVVRFVLDSRHPVHNAKTAAPMAFSCTLGILFLAATYKGLPKITIDLPLPWHLAITAGIVSVAFFLSWWIIHRNMFNARVLRRDRYAVVERWFGRLQVMTACYMSFAHGANDVASAIGPLAASMAAFSGQPLGVHSEISPWLMAFGGAGIVIGLATMGYKVIRTLGNRITEITPTRGFCADFATASTVLICSKLGLPISTTFVMVGAITGVGFARGIASLDLRVIRQILSSWVVTIPISAVLAGTIYWLLIAIPWK